MPLLAITFLGMGLACTGFPARSGSSDRSCSWTARSTNFRHGVCHRRSVGSWATIRICFSLFCGRPSPPTAASARRADASRSVDLRRARNRAGRFRRGAPAAGGLAVCGRRRDPAGPDCRLDDEEKPALCCHLSSQPGVYLRLSLGRGGEDSVELIVQPGMGPTHPCRHRARTRDRRHRDFEVPETRRGSRSCRETRRRRARPDRAYELRRRQAAARSCACWTPGSRSRAPRTT